VTWDWSPADLTALAAFLRRHGLTSGPVRARPIGEGHANLTYLVTDGTRQVVVRRPPPPPTPPGANDMLREARLLSALFGTGVPAPEVLAVAQAREVLDVPFYVMSYIRGVVATDVTPPGLRTQKDRHALAEALVETLATLHAVDWRAAGLEGFGRPEGFNARHVSRIGRLVADEDGKPPEAFAGLMDWLADNAPPESGASILHSDYRLGNVMLAPDPPARILAVLDWELATLGDPLLDLGYFVVCYPQPGEPLTPTGEFATAVLEPGYPTRAEIVERYAQASGRDVSNLMWYTTMALWKLAALYEHSHRRTVAGVGDPYYTDPELVSRFLAAAHRTAGLAALSSS
jgi:aminoglycoside phosphotransferase (APT) family kinase protein